MKRMKSVSVILLAVLALWVVPAAGRKQAACTSAPRPAGVVVDGFELSPEGSEVEWPGIISIFTKGGSFPKDPKQAANYLVAVKEAGFGAYWETIDKLPVLKKHGLKLLVCAWPDQSMKMAGDLRDNPDVLGYLMSMVTMTDKWSMLSDWETKMRKGDPKHPALYALDATWGSAGEFVGTIKPRAIYYRHYIHGSSHGGQWAPMNQFIYLEQARKEALAAGGLPIVRWTGLASPVKVRYTVHMSLLYGIRGFTWWQGWCFFDLKKTDKRGVPVRSDIGEEITRLHQTMKAFSPVFEKARCVAVYHTRPVPLRMKTTPKDFWAQPSGGHLALGVFVDREANRYLIVANRDTGKRGEATLKFTAPVKSVHLMDRATGEWKPLAMEQADKTTRVTVPLDVAGLEMLRVQRSDD